MNTAVWRWKAQEQRKKPDLKVTNNEVTFTASVDMGQYSTNGYLYYFLKYCAWWVTFKQK